MTATSHFDLMESSRSSSRIIHLVGAALVIFLTWAAFASVDEIVRSEGQVVSSSRAQIVQNLEGGILGELFVRQGDVVQAGQVLGKLQDTKFRAAADELQEQIDALEIKQYRLEAEMSGAFEFNVPAHLTQRSPEILASERALLKARQTDFNSRRESAHAIMTQLNEELENLKRLYKTNIVALTEVNKAQKSATDAAAKYNEIGTQNELDLAEEYSEALRKLASLRQELRLAQDQLNRTIITAPMSGIVNSLAVTTIGGVVRPGEEIFEIIPLGEELFVEARVNPKDIASVQPGQDATIKLSAYDYTIYGALKGKVDFVSADTFEDDRNPRAEPFYRVTVRVDRSGFTQRQQSIEIRPGMRATAELQTGSKTVLNYLLKPLYKSREAFREP
ncbi:MULTISPECIES: HlyD family type I secretion periplasmic adaptor subunit [Rhodobacterales]|jgi:adhesin transport system membrane fusion protein|uniref:Membrane fusion protein (MFP) family protein n=1 Tax=Phaeobacter gallaeciensis TaxID=60890 RepID=A0A1B0ZV79_9RHOB|nr:MULTISPECIES: HlyD family type I secretion periplasmic adaptor subunit [Phaeobacter]MDF1771505.1 HlyD family type I secretion periplasmic adaptor subunit [Pseudophaeobacter sp. bin_em_oilr2.035]MEC9312662.1 HlyD family type I secretion periplasmic adaptor subunit [Pseudomonadota bacterium]ANP38127.1 transporter [Phaeobacter gallaeciensis]MDE4097585.1 HlyD family type I secretion periplasmic adaptor subunit [Phaeobacter gallaeciensis]MDE4106577.1 HlyD family type I secretion periplasmic adap